ncbi:response regulator transcription factor [Pseudoxanthomonas sp. UTMC 1351]|uniref:response regulator transcription factor n=1 Tax=Pseudoxanthomonas sp. UTMC 1351 TaxID=2695853 RepID=UPI0034CD5986
MVGWAAQTAIVYIVDDDRDVRQAFARLMRAAGLEPRPYDCAEEFLAEVCESPRACLLLDIAMPNMTGPQVQARLNEGSIHLPVIAVSARDDEEIRSWTRRLGARMFLRKPVDDQALLDAINWVIDHQAVK